MILGLPIQHEVAPLANTFRPSARVIRFLKKNESCACGFVCLVFNKNAPRSPLVALWALFWCRWWNGAGIDNGVQRSSDDLWRLGGVGYWKYTRRCTGDKQRSPKLDTDFGIKDKPMLGFALLPFSLLKLKVCSLILDCLLFYLYQGVKNL